MENYIRFKYQLFFVQQILAGNAKAWRFFKNRHAGRMLERAWQLCRKTYSNLPADFNLFLNLLKNRQRVSEKRRQDIYDEFMEIYRFIIYYFYNPEKKAGKLKFYDGRSRLTTYVIQVLIGRSLKTDWLRHKWGVNFSQIPKPAEIQALPFMEQAIYLEMVLRRRPEVIARNLKLDLQQVESAMQRIENELRQHGHWPPGPGWANIIPIDENFEQRDLSTQEQVLMGQALNLLWEKVCALIGELAENEKILLDMFFDRELDAKAILKRCRELNLPLPVKVKSSEVTIHHIYQSINDILSRLGERLQKGYPGEVENCRRWLEEERAENRVEIFARGLKLLLKEMGIYAAGKGRGELRGG